MALGRLVSSSPGRFTAGAPPCFSSAPLSLVALCAGSSSLVGAGSPACPCSSSPGRGLVLLLQRANLPARTSAFSNRARCRVAVNHAFPARQHLFSHLSSPASCSSQHHVLRDARSSVVCHVLRVLFSAGSLELAP
ncbi:uncharacterized protein LOC100381513 [Zea mays]|uniref:Uncharacterized protein n=1 Tax=Zea mays TaxID=4577 RepID=C0HGL3_MAIZE|nr:uncharacterized protein LOC100381513 [Zea mays]ACN26166.1 unknown [Zea mays]|eukprot:NP_001167814.1 uncharacterized protein LOC100381513 [Zea mays]